MNKAIGMFTLKNAALYHERVIPINLALEYYTGQIQAELNFEEYQAHLNEHRVLDELLPEEFQSDQEFIKKLNNVNQKSFKLRNTMMAQDGGFSRVEDSQETIISASKYFRSIRKFIKQFSLENLTADYRIDHAGYGETGSQLFSISMSELKLIDASLCDWEHILEFRKDKGAADKLRKLRLHFVNFYPEKERAFIEDDLLERIREYDDTIDEWGFETISGSLGMLLSSKILAGSAAGAFVSSLAGAPITAIAGAAAGVVIEIGRITVHFKKQKFDLNRALRNNPVSFIKYAEEKLEK